MFSLASSSPLPAARTWLGANSTCIAWLLALTAVIALANFLWLSRVNAWVLGGGPIIWGVNPIIGYSYLAGGETIHEENISPLWQTLSFNGQVIFPDGYFLRALYPFFVSLFTWCFGLKGAALTVNYLAYAGLVMGTAWFGFQLGGRRSSAVIAGALAATCPAAFVHLNDLSAHLLGNALWIGISAAIYASRVWCERRPASVHFRIGLLLMLANLAYPSGTLLTAAYFAVAIWWSARLSVIAAAALAFAARPVWGFFLARAAAHFLHLDASRVSLADYSAYASSAFSIWWGFLHQGVGPLLTEVKKPLLDCLFVAFPLVIVLGLAAAIFLGVRSFRKLWFLLVFAGLPCVGVVFFSPTATARGYIAGGAATVLFACLAGTLSAVPERYRRWTVGVAGLVILLQLAWSLSYLFGYYFPLSAFCWGYSHDPNPLVIPVVRNLAETFPVWRLYGGTADFIGAGGLPLGSFAAASNVRAEFWYAALLDAFFFLVVFLVAKFVFSPTGWLAADSGTPKAEPACRWSIWLGAWVLSCLTFAALGRARPARMLDAFVPHGITRYSGRQEINRGIDLAASSVTSLRAAVMQNPQAEIQMALMGGPFVESRLRIGSMDVPAKLLQFYAAQSLWRLDRETLLKSLEPGAATLDFTGVLEDGSLGGWQRGGVTGQRVQPATLAQGTPYLPGLELRLYDPIRQTMLWVGY